MITIELNLLYMAIVCLIPMALLVLFLLSIGWYNLIKDIEFKALCHPTIVVWYLVSFILFIMASVCHNEYYRQEAAQQDNQKEATNK